jgi:very-short-patch-repair endonuclease
VGDGKRARWKPAQDPHLAGSGYRHGKTHTNRRGSTSARQRAHSGHVFTRFLNGQAGFPILQAQHQILTVDGQLLYVLDIAWPTVRIALQYDGYAAHDKRNKRDSERDGRMAGRGRITVRATAADLSDPSRVRDDLRAASR